MNESRKSDPVGDYSYLLKASELIEIAKCRAPAEAVELIADELRGLAAKPARSAVVYLRANSGFRHRAENAGQSCSKCGDAERRLYKHGCSLDCADCIMSGMLEEKFRGQ